MMRGVAPKLESHHRVRILDEAVRDSVRLSLRYIPARQLPDKSVSVLDTACARVALARASTPARIEDLSRRIDSMETEQKILEREKSLGIDHSERLEALQQERQELQTQLSGHEERWEKFLWRKAPEVCGVPDFKLEKLLRFEDLDIQEIGGRQLTKAGGLWILHGHEFFNTFDPVNFARTLQVKTGVCTIAGHKHKTSQHSVKSMDGDTIACWSVGCLCDLEPDYMPVNQWNLGFAEITHEGKKFEVNNYRIIDGVAYR